MKNARSCEQRSLAPDTLIRQIFRFTFSSNGSGNPNISNADGCGGKSIRMYENVHIEINRGWNERMFNTVCYKYYLIV